MMTTTQPAMTDVSTKGNTYTSPSVTAEEPKADRISFKDSLRFFQEQLMNANKTVSDLPNGNSFKCNMKLNGKRNSIDSTDSAKTVETDEDITVLYTNSKITPIPTVDTILESVRILRAIQRSQSQKGDALWTLDITTSNTELSEPYKDLEIEFQKDLTEVSSFSSSEIETESIDVTDVVYSSDALHLTNNAYFRCDDKTKINTSVNDDNSCIFWPKSVGSNEVAQEKVLHVVEFQASVTGNDFDFSEQTAETHPKITHLNSNSESCSLQNDDESVPEKHSNVLPKSLSDSTECLEYVVEDAEENAEDFSSCCSLSLHDENSEPKLDLPHGERSTSTESDSGIGTDKSVGSLSPVRGEDVEKILWIESSSSEYASAECSPCASLTRASGESVLPNNISASSDFENSELDALSKSDELNPNVNVEENILCDQLERTNHNTLEESTSNIKCGSESEDVQRISSPISSTDSSSDQIIETVPNVYNLENPESHDCDMSRERLVEIVEDKIQQLELRLDENTASDQENNDSSPAADVDISVSFSDGQEFSQRQSNNTEESLVANDVIMNKNQNAQIPASDGMCQEDARVKTPALENDCLMGCRNEQEVEQNNQVPTKNESSHEVLKYSILEADKEVYVSSLECQLTNSELKLREIDGNEAEEPVRSKKTVTVSWDPVPLVEHLYSSERWKTSEESINKKVNIEGYLNILPHEIFTAIGGETFCTLEDGFISFWENEDRTKLLTNIPLQYASIESSDENMLLLDNRLGRNVKIKFESENELLRWKQALQSQCNQIKTTSFLEPVNYPLKSHKKVVIIDLGSCSTRAGILMDQPTLPNLFFPTICATDKSTGKRLYGTEALLPEVRQNSTLTFPVRPSAKITKFTMDIEALSGLFKSIFSKLNVNPKDYAVQISIPRSLSTSTQAALVELLLEDLGVKAVSLTRQALLTLYANNTSTAIVVDIGDRMDVLPVVDGFILECGVSRLPYGGQRIIHHMKHALAQKHLSLSNDVESLIVQYISENLCYIAHDYDDELHIAMSNPDVVKKSLPLYPFFKEDNVLQTVTLDIGRFQVPEGLFNPDLWGIDFQGLHKLVHHAIQTSGMDVRRAMAENIYVSGGVTLIPGFVERLQKEVAKLTLPRLKPQVHASPYRYHMAYLGACQLAASDAFPQVCVSSKEWHGKGQICLNKWHL